MQEDSETAGLDPTTVAVRALIGASRDLVVRMARAMQMNGNDMTAIALLMDRGAMGVAELGEHLGIRQPSATALADRLEAAGHVERVRSVDDRRRVMLSATDAARQAALAAWMPGVLQIDAVCRTLGEDDQRVVRTFLRDITQVIDRTGRPDASSAPRDTPSPAR